MRLDVAESTEQGRVQLLVAVPAASAEPRWTLGALLAASCVPEGQPTAPRSQAACADRLMESLGSTVTRARLDSLLRMPLASSRSMRPVRGRFPLVLIDGGLLGDAAAFASLAEYVASHGYVVVSVPSRPWAGQAPTFDAHGVKAKIAGLRLALNIAATFPNVDASRTVVAAWSVGGLSAAWLAASDARVVSFLSLDSGIGYAYAPAILAELGASRLSPKPVLHVTGGLQNPFPVQKDRTMLSRSPGPAWIATVAGIHHSHFVPLTGALPVLLRSPTSSGRRMRRFGG